MLGKITIFLQNCQGVANPQKRKAIFRHVRAKKYKTFIFSVSKSLMLKLNGDTMHILVVIIVVVEAF